VLANIVLGIAHGSDFLGVFLGYFDAEFFLEGHDQLDQIERVRVQILLERGA
jgi:hypothetical protein